MRPIGDWEGRLMGGRYQLTELIAKGGMSYVFKALDCQNDNSLVVVKFAPKNSAYNSENVTWVNRLKREADALRELDNPRIVRLLDCGDDEKCFFVVLEYLEGKTLAKCITDKDLVSNGFLLSLVIQMLEGLEAMGKAGMIHRDFKPANLMVSPDGIKIIDLGLVKFVNSSGQRSRRLTSPGAIVGTLKYLSPEQFQNRDNLDSRSDLFNCGVIMYELLAGAFPFIVPNGDDDHLVNYWDHPFRGFPDKNKIPDEIKAIILKALAVDPDLRFQTAEEMRLALLAVMPFPLKEILNKFFGSIRDWFWYKSPDSK